MQKNRSIQKPEEKMSIRKVLIKTRPQKKASLEDRYWKKIVLTEMQQILHGRNSMLEITNGLQ